MVSVTELRTDGTRNAIAGYAEIDGDCRNFSPAVSEAIEAAIRRIAASVGAAHRCEIENEYTRVFTPLINEAVPRRRRAWRRHGRRSAPRR